MHKSLHLILILTFCSFVSQSQDKPRTSPLAIASMLYKDAYVKITYSKPQKRGREIFGKLVPYDKVWRTGANEATELTITHDIQINNTVIKAGTYSIFSIPQKDQWTIIINDDVGLWGAYNYNASLDILRFNVPVKPSDKFYESFTIIFNQKNDLADLLILWDRIYISIPIKFIN
jgi:hypothetical protein